MLQYIARASQAILAYAKTRISLLGIRKFAVEATGVYAIDEIVDTGAEYSQWIEENSDLLKIALSLGLLAKNSSLALMSKEGTLSGAKIIYSKMAIKTPIHRLVRYAQMFSVQAHSGGVGVYEGGRLVLSLAVSSGKITINNNCGVIAGSVLAATLAGTVPSSKEEWEATGQQLKLHLAESTSILAEHTLRTRLNKFSPVTLLRNGALYVETFLRDFPAFSPERAVSILFEVQAEEAVRVGTWSIDTFTDVDDIKVIRIDGLHFQLVEGSNTSVLVPYSPKELQSSAAPELQNILAALLAALNKIDEDGGVSLKRVGDTQRFISTPFIVGSVGLMIVIDRDKGGKLQFVVAEDTLFDSIEDNLSDDFDETMMEGASRLTSELGDATSKWADETWSWIKQETVGVSDSSDDQQTNDDVEPVPYRSVLVHLTAQDLTSALGKW